MEGTLIKVMKPQSFPSGFVKREFVVRTDEMYPQEIVFQLFKDKISLIDDFQMNDQLKVSFNIRGSQWEGRFFTNLQVCSNIHSPLDRGDGPQTLLPSRFADQEL